jgi:hypothetical protein
MLRLPLRHSSGNGFATALTALTPSIARLLTRRADANRSHQRGALEGAYKQIYRQRLYYRRYPIL